ncbi:MAG TPA: arginine deiminase-related protein [Candidatus Sulfotelmatobacter sp.]|nr:arginine deiminase-related protein [Candidatus Sulfotelmatobacter sp.]
MCRPVHFSVEYAINPHMKPGSTNLEKANRQWQNLVDTLRKIGVYVEIIDQVEGVPDMVFAADQGIVRGGEILLANFRFPQRQPETATYAKWFEAHGIKTKRLPAGFSFEGGGDSLFFNDMLFVGTGYRASVGSCEEIANALDIDVMPLRVIDPFFYHMDMSFMPLSPDTAFYYPKSISENSRSILKKLVPNLYELSLEEVHAYSANSFISGNQIVISAEAPESFRKRLHDLGMNIFEADISEFKKAGGGIHCLINPIE